MNVSASTCVRDRDCAYVGQMADKLLINAGLQALCICGVYEKLAAIWFQQGDVGWICDQLQPTSWVMSFTLVDLKFSDRLPPVHSHSPAIVDFTTTEVYDEFVLVAIKSVKHRL